MGRKATRGGKSQTPKRKPGRRGKLEDAMAVEIATEIAAIECDPMVWKKVRNGDGDRIWYKLCQRLGVRYPTKKQEGFMYTLFYHNRRKHGVGRGVYVRSIDFYGSCCVTPIHNEMTDIG